jgi:hypothetical protein
LATLQRVYPPRELNDWLSGAKRNVTSQCGEDGIVEKIFETLGVADPWCVEFGAWDGKTFSNTWNLINNGGWSAVLIEADAAKSTELEQAYAANSKVTPLNRLVGFEGDSRLDSILEGTPIPENFDFLCIDIDGNDYHVWQAVKRFRPRIVAIEFNPSMPNDVIFIQDKNHEINQGCSLRALIELGKTKGYELISTTEWNAFFAQDELFPQFNIDENSIDKIHDPRPFETKLVQLYDGTLLVAGLSQLLWHNIPISPQDIQVLPQALRRYPPRGNK